MNHFVIKICGIRDPKNMEEILLEKPDMMGFIFYEGSPRNMGNDSILPIDLSWGATQRVGVFVNADITQIREMIQTHDLHYIQLHGEESPIFCRDIQSTGIGVIKAFGIDVDFDFVETEPYHPYCDFFLFDSKSAGQRGGTGTKFPWSFLSEYQGPTPFMLSGGIGKEDIPLIRSLDHPFLMGIDLNSKVEKAPGLKDINLVNHVIKSLRNDQI